MVILSVEKNNIVTHGESYKLEDLVGIVRRSRIINQCEEVSSEKKLLATRTADKRGRCPRSETEKSRSHVRRKAEVLQFVEKRMFVLERANFKRNR